MGEFNRGPYEIQQRTEENQNKVLTNFYKDITALLRQSSGNINRKGKNQNGVSKGLTFMTQLPIFSDRDIKRLEYSLPRESETRSISSSDHINPRSWTEFFRRYHKNGST